MDLAVPEARWPDRALRLTPLEGQFLAFLAASRGATVRQEELLRRVWNYHPGVQTRAVSLLVARLRKKVEEVPDHPVWLQTVHGTGVRLVAETPSGRLLAGRQRELAALTAWSQGSEPTFVVSGPDGIGKTHLVGAWFDRAGIAARTLDARGAADMFALMARVEARSVADAGAELLVVEDARFELDVADLRRRFPRARYVITTRTPLNGAGLTLGPLPEDAAVAMCEALAPTDAVWTRRQLQEGVALLGGVPWAIAAAARLAHGSAPAAWLDALRSRGPHGADEALIRTQWAQLPEGTRELLLVFSRWEGEVSVDLLLAAGAGRVPAAASLAPAVEAGWVQITPGAPDTARWIGLAQAWVRQQIDAARVQVEDRARVNVLVPLAARLVDALEGPGAAAAGAELLRRRDTFLQTAQVADPDEEVQLLVAACEAGQCSDLRMPLERLWALAESASSSSARRAAARAAVGGAWRMGGARVACDAYTDFLTREGVRGGPGALRDRAEDGVVLGGLFAELNRREEAAACFAQAITHARMIGSTLLEGRVLHRQASMARRSGRMDEAAALYEASLRVLEAGGHHRRRAYALHNAGILAWEVGDIDLAEARVRASAALFEEIGQRPDAVEAVGSLVTYLLARGELSEAFARVEENIRFQRRAHDHRALTYGLLARGRISLERGEWDDARGDLEQVRLLAEAGSVRALRAATQYLGWLAHQTGRQGEAIGLYGSAISLADQHHEPIPAAVCAWWTEIASRGSVDASEVDGARSRGVDLGAWMRMAERPGPWSYDRRLTRALIDVRPPRVTAARGR